MATSNAAITKKPSGSYNPTVELSDGRRVSLTDLMIETYNTQGDVSGVKENLIQSYTRTVTNATNDFLYTAPNPPRDLLRVPTLEELGFPSVGYRIDVMGVGYLRTPAPDADIEIKLIDNQAADVAGSLAAGSVISNVFDSPVKTNKVTVAGGTFVALDFRRTSGADDIIIYNQTLLIQVVKV